MKLSILRTLRSCSLLALACSAVMFVVPSTHAADAAADAPASNSLQSIDVQKLSGHQVQLTMHLSGPAPEPLAFTIDKPARISIDLPNTTLALSSRRIDVGAGAV